MKDTNFKKHVILALAAVGFMAAGTAIAAEHGGEPVDSGNSAEHAGHDKAGSEHMKSGDEAKDKKHAEDKHESGQEHPGN